MKDKICSLARRSFVLIFLVLTLLIGYSEIRASEVDEEDTYSEDARATTPRSKLMARFLVFPREVVLFSY
jgi:hypothetical protein